ncbi:hypothetical protein BP6252_06094 [Coleophoma cylindrospora]|uniref:Extracellular membrane protein CFEM domain-containing protein n=1 Tax=Coleophoma cylindrospora TaxID=1849047 RepID=A0A3D8RLH6_9HELO|nr:hypothetical protein BP6252_06094 [Coleophoma cylindrospora]
MLLSMTAVLFAVLPFSLAQSICTTSNASTWPPVGSSSGGSSSGGSSSGGSGDLAQACDLICAGDATCLKSCNSDPCAEQFPNDPTSLAACYKAQQLGDCNILGGSACDGLKTRASTTFTCSSSQTCYVYTDGSLFCLNESSGDYVDDVGGHGNVDTGVYTGPDGQKTTVLAGATATAKASAASTAKSAASKATSTASNKTAVASGTKTSATGASATAASATGTSSAAASTTGTSGVEKLNAAPVLGALGLVAALVL